MYFEQFSEVQKTDTIGITSLLTNITTRPGSHKGGWARLLKSQLKSMGHGTVEVLTNSDKLEDFDIIIFDLGAEYSGALNMFGGLDSKVFSRLNEIKKYTGKMYSWRNEMPDLKILEQRRTNSSTCQEFKDSHLEYLNEVSTALESVKVFRHCYQTRAMVIGDSHTPSVWNPEYGIVERRDGRTLKGMVEHSTLGKLLKEYDVDKVHVHCSSIDIRHHIMREANPREAIALLAAQLCEQLRDSGKEIVVTESIGIEDETRSLPKTGYFKGTPFYGSWSERDTLRQIFNEVIKTYAEERGWVVLKYPTYFFDETGKMKFEVMEKPQSVHISPEHYYWDLENNIKRW